MSYYDACGVGGQVSGSLSFGMFRMAIWRGPAHVALRRFTFYLGARLGFRRFYPASLGESRQN
jgi:hypothetical protein